MRIAVIGYSGSGKSTLAGALAKHFFLPVLYLDTVQFTPGWQERERSAARKLVREFMEQNKEGWVIDGNYKAFYQEERLSAADSIIFMNFNRFSCLKRALSRYFKYRHKTRESMAEGCEEKFDCAFFWWIIAAGRSPARRAHYRAITARYTEKMVVLRNQRQLDAFLAHAEERLNQKPVC